MDCQKGQGSWSRVRGPAWLQSSVADGDCSDGSVVLVMLASDCRDGELGRGPPPPLTIGVCRLPYIFFFGSGGEVVVPHVAVW